MKRFILFAGSEYYPGGGWNDFRGFFDSTEEINQYLAGKSFDWWHWYDTKKEITGG